jgi:SAM-dependent methyltransferase
MLQACATLVPCPVCGATDVRACDPRLRPTMVRCRDCTLLYQPVVRGEPVAEGYPAQYYGSWGQPEHARAVKRATFDRYLQALERHVSPGRLLDVGCALGYLLEAAAARGWEPYGVELSVAGAQQAAQTVGEGRVFCGALEAAPLQTESFQAVTLTDVLEHLPDPVASLRRCRELLAPGGMVLIATPRVGGFSERVMGRQWFQYKDEHLQLFTPRALQEALGRAGLQVVDQAPVRKLLSLQYLAGQFEAYPRPLVTPVLRLLNRLAGPLGARLWALPTGEQMVLARAAGSTQTQS